MERFSLLCQWDRKKARGEREICHFLRNFHAANLTITGERYDILSYKIIVNNFLNVRTLTLLRGVLAEFNETIMLISRFRNKFI